MGGRKNSGPCLLLLLLLLTNPNFWLLSLTLILQVEIVASLEQAMHSVASRPFCKMFLQPGMTPLHHPCFPDPSTHHLFPVLPDPLQLEPPLLYAWHSPHLLLQHSTHKMHVRHPCSENIGCECPKDRHRVLSLYYTPMLSQSSTRNTKNACGKKARKKESKEGGEEA